MLVTIKPNLRYTFAPHFVAIFQPHVILPPSASKVRTLSTRLLHRHRRHYQTVNSTVSLPRPLAKHRAHTFAHQIRYQFKVGSLTFAELCHRLIQKKHHSHTVSVHPEGVHSSRGEAGRDGRPCHAPPSVARQQLARRESAVNSNVCLPRVATTRPLHLHRSALSDCLSVITFFVQPVH